MPESAPWIRIITLLLSLLITSQAIADDQYDESLFLASSTPDDDSLLLTLFDEEDEFTALATGTPMLISKAPAVSTVITAKQIKAMGAIDIDQVLETVPGLHVSRYYQFGNPIYIFRGAYTVANPQVLVMINNIPINTLMLSNPHNIWGGMPVEAISRIEVVRGPASAIYGAEAFAGVINVVTKGGDELSGTEVGARAGSFMTRDAWISHGSQWNGYDLGFFLEYHKTDGHGEIIEHDAQTNLDKDYSTNATNAPGPVTLTRNNLDMRLDIKKDKWRWRLGTQQRRNAGLYAGVVEALEPSTRYASSRWSTDLTWHDPQVTDEWDVQLQFSYLRTSQEIYKDHFLILYPPGSTPIAPAGLPDAFPDGMIGNPEVWERHYRFEVTTLFSGIENHQVRLGLGRHFADIYRTEETKNFGVDPNNPGPFTFPTTANSPIYNVTDTPYIYLPEKTRGNVHAYIQDIWSIASDWHLTTGVRHDRYSDFSSVTNPRIALVWWTNYNLTTKLMHGRAFRSPSFTEMHNQANPVIKGNPSLAPEKIATTELAFDYRPDESLVYELNFFHYVWRDKIEGFVDVGTGAEQAQNLGRQTGHGLEFSTSWQAKSNLAFNANYSWQRSTNKKLHHDAANAPHHQVYVRSDWVFKPDWHLNAQINWVGEREREQGDTRSPVSDYTTVDTTLRYSPNNTPWEIAAIVYNLFDEIPREPSFKGKVKPALPADLPQAGRSMFVEARYRF